MRTIFSIANRNFTTLEFAQKFADKNSLGYSLISESQMEERNPQRKVFVGKESQEKYNERRANID
jgi:hypothetical protein